MKIVSVAQMRALEAAAFAAGDSEAALQHRAGTAVARVVFSRVKPGERVVVFVGHGNNGRDGAVAADWLARRGVGIDLVLAPRHAVTVDELEQLRGRGASVIPAASSSSIDAALGAAGVAVDGLAGIGTHGALREPLASLAGQLNAARHHLTVIAVDVPSGIDADTGEVPGQAVRAGMTVTLGAVKQGLLRFPAAECVGTLIASDIGLPSAPDLPYSLLDLPQLGLLVPPRPLDAHKYRFGRVLVVAGSDHYLGAPVLSAGAALRIGAGLVTVGASRDVRLNVAAHFPEATFTTDDVRPADGIQPLEAYLSSHNVMVVGPGLSRGPVITDFVRQLLEVRPRDHRLVVDADGLTALAEIPDWPGLLGPNVVLTPHSGELERLVGHALSLDEPLWVHAARLATRWGCVLTAKGPFTCIAQPDGRVDVWPVANPALATGGTGDVLAGVTAGLLAQDMPVWNAARLAVGVHGLAAQRVVSGRQWRTLVASDLLGELPAALESLPRTS